MLVGSARKNFCIKRTTNGQVKFNRKLNIFYLRTEFFILFFFFFFNLFLLWLFYCFHLSLSLFCFVFVLLCNNILINEFLGYVFKIEEPRSHFFSYSDYAFVIQMKMIPSDRDDFPDLFLIILNRDGDKYEKFILELNKGNKLSFSATFISEKDMILRNINKEEGFMEFKQKEKQSNKFLSENSEGD